MGKKIDVAPGERYGRLVVIKEAQRRFRGRYFYCKCDCGNMTVSRLHSLRIGESNSCGCLRKERFIKNNTKHHGSRTKIYKVWTSIKQRCLNEKSKPFKDYGGRGICLHKEWIDFEVFKSWAESSGYKEGLTIERVDNNGHYHPDNCTWIPQSIQNCNTRRSRKKSKKYEDNPNIQQFKREHVCP